MLAGNVPAAIGLPAVLVAVRIAVTEYRSLFDLVRRKRNSPVQAGRY
jgi:hypothetical protein